MMSVYQHEAKSARQAEVSTQMRRQVSQSWEIIIFSLFESNFNITAVLR